MLAAGAPSRTPLRELMTLPDTPSQTADVAVALAPYNSQLWCTSQIAVPKPWSPHSWYQCETRRQQSKQHDSVLCLIQLRRGVTLHQYGQLPSHHL